jgi:ubiquinone/menaquinone biosynthesis C-methylase UbiE
MQHQHKPIIRTKPHPICLSCGETGIPLHYELTDRMGSAPGTWDFKHCPNPECGLIWLDPMPLEEDIIHAYEAYYTHINGATRIRRPNARALYIALKYGYRLENFGPSKTVRGLIELLDITRYSWFDQSVMYLPAKHGGRLLEIGFGNGDTLLELERLGWKTEGVDFDEVAVEGARKRGLDVHAGTLEHQQYPDNHFDAIVMSHVIEHIHDPLRLLTECRRILKTGGKLTILTPNNQSMTRQRFGDACFALDPPRHLYFYNSNSLEKLIIRAGFNHLDISTTTRNARSFYLASKAISATGHYLPPVRMTPKDRLQAIIFHMEEWLRLRFSSIVGEELAVQAMK